MDKNQFSLPGIKRQLFRHIRYMRVPTSLYLCRKWHAVNVNQSNYVQDEPTSLVQRRCCSWQATSSHSLCKKSRRLTTEMMQLRSDHALSLFTGTAPQRPLPVKDQWQWQWHPLYKRSQRVLLCVAIAFGIQPHAPGCHKEFCSVAFFFFI